MFSTEIVRVNQSLDNLFLRLSEYISKGYTLCGDYSVNGYNAIEFMEKVRNFYHPGTDNLMWDKESLYRQNSVFEAKDGSIWTTSNFV